jgi:hypothetical protein
MSASPKRRAIASRGPERLRPFARCPPPSARCLKLYYFLNQSVADSPRIKAWGASITVARPEALLPALGAQNILSNTMDQETLRKIAGQLAQSSYMMTWVPELVTFGLGVFLGGYLKARGKDFPTRNNCRRLQEQLSAKSKLAETSKAEAEKYRAAREWSHVRCIKLEELLKKAGACESYLDRYNNGSIPGEAHRDEHDPSGDLSALATLYFPELKIVVTEYLLQYKKLYLAKTELVYELSQAGNDSQASEQALHTFRANKSQSYPQLLSARTKLDEAARGLLVQIVGVAAEQYTQKNSDISENRSAQLRRAAELFELAPHEGVPV